jgi:hypothetical protein
LAFATGRAKFVRVRWSQRWNSAATDPCWREMNAMPEIGKFLVVIGIVIVVVGALLWSGFGAGWLGRLPGDIRIERGNTAFYFPIVTCIVISIVLSLIFSLFRR